MNVAARFVVGCWLLVLALGGTTPRADAQLAQRMLDLLPEETSRGSSPSGLSQVADQRVVFSAASQRLWVTDGTTTGTSSLAKACPDCLFSSQLAALPGRTLHLVFRPSRITSGFYELWSSDGTLAGTLPLPLVSTAFPLSSTNLLVLDGLAYFSWFDFGGGSSVWATDGTVRGTQRFELPTGSCPFAQPQDFVAGPERIFFVAASGLGCAGEIWQIEGGGSAPRVVVAAPAGPVVRQANAYQATATHLFYKTIGGGGSERLWSVRGPGAPSVDLLPRNVALVC